MNTPYHGYTESPEAIEERKRRILDGTYGRRTAEQPAAEYQKVMTPDGLQYTFAPADGEQLALL